MVRWKSPTQHQEYRQRLTISSTIRAGQVECARNKGVEEEEGKHRDTEDTERFAQVKTYEKCGRSTTETAGILLCVFAPLHLCVYLALNLEEGIEDRFADVVEFRLKMIDEFMQSVIHDLFDVQKF